MLSKLRTLWRRSRAVPLVGRILATIDRLWWAHTIRRADIVDVDLVRAQVPGRPMTARRAVRAYVRGGFRSGLVLNPLFLEEFVSAQLPDADRVPALYAYLVSDSARIETTVAWSAAAHGDSYTDSQRVFGGALGHAWGMLRRGGAVQVGGTRVDLPTLNNKMLSALDERAWQSPVEPERYADDVGVVLIARLDEDDTDGHLLTAVTEFIRSDSSAKAVASLDAAAAPPSLRAAAALIALSEPRIRLEATAPAELSRGTIVLRRDPGSEVSVETLHALQQAASEGSVMPLLLSPDGTVAAAGVIARGERGYPLLTGFPAEDARALGATTSTAAAFGPVMAERVGFSTAARVITTHSVMIGKNSPDFDPVGPIPLPGVADSSQGILSRRLVVAGWTKRGPSIRTVDESHTLPDGRVIPRLRWGIKTAAPAGPRGESWGDTHFARGLAAALERLGQYVAVDARPAALRPSSGVDEVSLVLRGPHRINPPSSGMRLLWVISHPDEISAPELADFDHVFAASRSWSRSASARFGREIEPLLQCTDPTRFRPAGLHRDGNIVFVGTARGIHRPAVIAPTRAGIPLRVYGPDWRGYIPAAQIADTGIPNDELPARYESAGVVLNDHWPDMRRNGFISNRPYDVLAAGGRVISDDVEGMEEEFAGAVAIFRDESELVRMLRGDLDRLFPHEDELTRVGALIRQRDSFDARAATLLEVVLSSR